MSYSLHSQTISVDRIKRANELIIKGQRCDSIVGNLNALIMNQDTQIMEMSNIRIIQDSIIFNNGQMIINKDSIISNKDQIIEVSEKKIRKHKRISIASIALVILVLLL